MGGVISASRDPAQTQQAGHRCASLMSQSSESATPQWPVRRKRAPQARPRARAGDTSAPWIPTATSQSQDPAQAPRQLAPPSIPVPPKPPPPPALPCGRPRAGSPLGRKWVTRDPGPVTFTCKPSTTSHDCAGEEETQSPCERPRPEPHSPGALPGVALTPHRRR